MASISPVSILTCPYNTQTKKKFRDAEAKIVAQVGPHWECILYVLPFVIVTYICLPRPNGVTFTAAPGSKEFLKTWAPKKDDIVSFRHSGFFAGSKRPKFPLLYRLRPDLSWESVVSNWNDQTESSGSGMQFSKIRCERHNHTSHFSRGLYQTVSKHNHNP